MLTAREVLIHEHRLGIECDPDARLRLAELPAKGNDPAADANSVVVDLFGDLIF